MSTPNSSTENNKISHKLKFFFEIKQKAIENYWKSLINRDYEEYWGKCNICFNESECKKLECGHSLCKICMKNYLDHFEKGKDAKSLTCIYYGCDHVLTLKDV